MISAYFYGDRHPSGDRIVLEIQEYADGIYPRRFTKRMYDNVIFTARFLEQFCSEGFVEIKIFKDDRYLFHITYFIISFDDCETYGCISIDGNLIRSFKLKD